MGPQERSCASLCPRHARQTHCPTIIGRSARSAAPVWAVHPAAPFFFFLINRQFLFVTPKLGLWWVFVEYSLLGNGTHYCSLELIRYHWLTPARYTLFSPPLLWRPNKGRVCIAGRGFISIFQEHYIHLIVLIESSMFFMCLLGCNTIKWLRSKVRILYHGFLWEFLANWDKFSCTCLVVIFIYDGFDFISCLFLPTSTK